VWLVNVAVACTFVCISELHIALNFYNFLMNKLVHIVSRHCLNGISVALCSVGTEKPGSSGWYLQKTLPGGIMLIELRFRKVFFCVSIYAYEWRPMSDGRKINGQVPPLH